MKQGKPGTAVAGTTALTWVRDRRWSNLGDLALAAFMGFLASLNTDVLIGSICGLVFLCLYVPVRFWRWRRASGGL